MNDDFKNYIQLLIDNKDKITHLPERDIHKLLDYITNLQQENERLKLYRHQLKQKLEAKNKRIKMIKDILNGRSDE